MLIRGTGLDATNATADGIYTLPTGWKSDLTLTGTQWSGNHGSGAYAIDIYMWIGTTVIVNIRRTLIGAYKVCNVFWRHTTVEAWPTTPPV